MSAKTVYADRTTRLAFAAVMIFASLLFTYRLGERSFRNPDEGRYALIASEMLESGDWTRPTLHGVGYFRKPPLFYWLVALSFRTLGSGEFAARIVPALFGLFGVAATFCFARRFYGMRGAVFSALVLGTNFWYVQTSRYLVLDSVFSFFVTASLYSFYLGVRDGRRAWSLSFWACLALAFLAKGFVGPALILPPALLYAVLTRSARQAFPPAATAAGVFLFLAIAAPAYGLLESREPGFLKFFFANEHWQRFMSPDFENQEPWYYYLAVLPLMLLPWALFVRPLRLAFADARRKANEEPRFFLLVCTAAMLVFFSLSRSKMPAYLMPCLPLLSLVLAAGWDRWFQTPVRLAPAEFAAIAFLFFAGLAVMIGGPWLVSQRVHKYPEPIVTDLQTLGGGVLAGAVLCLRSLSRGDPSRLFYSLAGLMAIVSALFAPVMETMNVQYSTRSFADRVKSDGTLPRDVFIYDSPTPFHDFSYYLDRRPRLVGLEGELRFAREDENAANVSVERAQFLEWLRADRPLVCLIRRSDFERIETGLRKGLRVLKEDNRKVLFVSGAGR